MKIQISLLTATLILLTACGPSEEEQAQQEQREQQLHAQMVQTTPAFNQQMEGLLERYLVLKDALVDTDPEAAVAASEAIFTKSGEVNVEELNQETATIWAAYKEVIDDNSREIAGAEDISDQRYHFEYLSETMIAMVETFEPVGYEVYHQSCPMVRDGSADWLSREEEIKNPYHGEDMMNCGETIQRL